MRKDLTELVFILDGSGSMYNLIDDTIGGFNSMLDKQKGKSGQALVSTVVFNTASRVLHDRVPIEKVAPLTRKDYDPEGGTALLDAVGAAVHHIGNVHKYARPEDVPEHTLFVITTDGLENSSVHYDHAQVKKMLHRQQEKYGWEFLFLGANIDAAESAVSIGIDRSRAVDYVADGKGTELNFQVMGNVIASIRAEGSVPQDWQQDIEADYRQRSGRTKRR